MKLKFTSLLLISALGFGLIACSEEEEPNPTPTPTPIVYGQIKTHLNKKLGGQQNNLVGSFFATDTGLVYGSVELSASVALQSKIDLVYFYGSSNGNSIGWPTDETVLFAHAGNTSVGNWTAKNNTLFSVTDFSVVKYDSVINDSMLTKIDSASFSTKLAAQLTANKVVAFKTANGKIGMFKVVSVEGDFGGNRAITINVKVQK